VKPPDASPSFWQRRVRTPLVALFTQGITPDKIAQTFAVGSACSLFPFVGFTSLLNLGAGLWLRLNQPLLQTLNQVLGPLQLLLILPYVRLGEWLWHAQDERFTIREMLQVFRDASMGEFLQRFGWAGIHAFTAWALTSPLLAIAVYHLLRPALHRLASKARPGA
jgi:uncharacterized protein (DUF2062 family)